MTLRAACLVTGLSRRRPIAQLRAGDARTAVSISAVNRVLRAPPRRAMRACALSLVWIVTLDALGYTLRRLRRVVADAASRGHADDDKIS